MKKINNFIYAALFLLLVSSSVANIDQKQERNKLILDFYSYGIKYCLSDSKKINSFKNLSAEHKFSELKKCFNSLKEKCNENNPTPCKHFKLMKDKIKMISKITVSKIQEDIKVNDYFKKTRHLKSGVPNIKIYSDSDLLTNGNKIDNIKEIRKMYTKLQKIENDIINLPNNIGCAKDEDCDAIAVGHRICGGPEMFLITSTRYHSNNAIIENITKYNSLAKAIQKKLRGFTSICSVEMKPIVRCDVKVCK